MKLYTFVVKYLFDYNIYFKNSSENITTTSIFIP